MIPQNLIGKYPKEQLERLYAPSNIPVNSAFFKNSATCQNMVVTINGRQFFLGKPKTFMWHYRRIIMLIQTRRLIKALWFDLRTFLGVSNG